jgi:hypothetical protein
VTRSDLKNWRKLAQWSANMATKKKAVKKKLVKKVDSELMFVLDGKILLEERVGKKLISSEEIDGKAVLQLLIRAVEDHCDRILGERKWSTEQQGVDLWHQTDKKAWKK